METRGSESGRVEGLDGRNILIVDDEPLISTCLVRYFKRFGAGVISHAVSGSSAQDVISSGLSPDIILSDLKMLDGTGKELFDWIKQNKPELLNGFIINSGGDCGIFEDFLEEMRERRRYLEKPFGIAELRMKVLEVLSSQDRSDK